MNWMDQAKSKPNIKVQESDHDKGHGQACYGCTEMYPQVRQVLIISGPYGTVSFCKPCWDSVIEQVSAIK